MSSLASLRTLKSTIFRNLVQNTRDLIRKFSKPNGPRSRSLAGTSTITLSPSFSSCLLSSSNYLRITSWTSTDTRPSTPRTWDIWNTMPGPRSRMKRLITSGWKATATSVPWRSYKTWTRLEMVWRPSTIRLNDGPVNEFNLAASLVADNYWHRLYFPRATP